MQNLGDSELLVRISYRGEEERGFTGCGKTLRNCHSERSEESGPGRFQEDTQSEILRCAQDDNRGASFRSLFSPALPAAQRNPFNFGEK
jgi:hypothetical protein